MSSRLPVGRTTWPAHLRLSKRSLRSILADRICRRAWSLRPSGFAATRSALSGRSSFEKQRDPKRPARRPRRFDPKDSIGTRRRELIRVSSRARSPSFRGCQPHPRLAMRISDHKWKLSRARHFHEQSTGSAIHAGLNARRAYAAIYLRHIAPPGRKAWTHRRPRRQRERAWGGMRSRRARC